jgi:hypothetical protein
MLAGVLRMLLGLDRLFLALAMVVLAVRLGGSAMGLRRRFVVFRRLIVCVFHFYFSCWPRDFGSCKNGLNSG